MLRRTPIKLHCCVCGDINLTPVHVRLVVCNVAERSYAAATCPTCRDEIRAPVEDYATRFRLALVGCEVVAWDIPDEALEVHEGPVIGVDDVLDLMLELRSGFPCELAQEAVRLARLVDEDA